MALKLAKEFRGDIFEYWKAFLVVDEIASKTKVNLAGYRDETFRQQNIGYYWPVIEFVFDGVLDKAQAYEKITESKIERWNHVELDAEDKEVVTPMQRETNEWAAAENI